ncbi:protoheme IX farnesyltransferase-like protein, partial [Leptotrombidium deliense]
VTNAVRIRSTNFLFLCVKFEPRTNRVLKSVRFLLPQTAISNYLPSACLSTKPAPQRDDANTDISDTSISLPCDEHREIKKFIKVENELEWKEIADPSAKDLVKYWLQLSKFRLTTLVVLTTLAGYSMASASFDASLMSATLLGTALSSSSAASLNQFFEIPYDSQMNRTRNRPLVLGKISPLHSVIFSAVTGVSGLAILSYFVNPITATLGVCNLVLYSFIYTPMKRANILNTWIGSIVGAVPPVMGFTAVTGVIDLPAILLGSLLFSWQFPHFNALSWNMRHDYARAGYRMMSVTNPDLCVRTAFRHSCLISLYTSLMSAPFIGLTHWSFALLSAPFNVYLIYLTWKFKSKPDANSSRKLFKYSLVHLPALILLMLLTKNSKKQDLTQPCIADNVKL